MRILQSAIRYPPAVGGVEMYVRRMSQGLAARGHAVEVITSDLADHRQGTRLDAPPPADPGVSVFRYPALPFRPRDYPIVPGMLGALLRRPADIVHGHSFRFWSADAAALAARWRGIPYVVNPYLAEDGIPSFAGRLYRATIGRLVMRAAAVVVISGYERELLARWGYHPAKVEMIPPGVDVEEFAVPQPDPFAARGITGPVLLCVGRLDPLKGADVLIRAMARLGGERPDVQAVFVGPDFGVRDDLMRLARELGIADRVHFLGALGRSELVGAFRHAAALVHPSRAEAFGIVLVEAMAAGLPVVGARAGAIPWVVEEGRTGLLFTRDDDADLAAVLRRLLGDEGLRRSLIAGGSREAAAQYQWHVQVDRLESLYQWCLEHHRRQAPPAADVGSVTGR